MSPDVEGQVEGAGAGTSAGSAGAGKRTEELIVGNLLDHGGAPYRFNPREAISYFVRIETTQGRRTIWGKDLERALQQSATRPSAGDEIGARRLGSEKVTGTHRERDAEGQVLKEEGLPVHRCRWVVEKREFFEARAKAAETFGDPAIEPRVGVQRHPDLVGSYLTLRAAELAAGSGMKHPDDRKKFVALVRQAMADSIARGEPFKSVRLRERAAVNPKVEGGGLPPEAERSPSRAEQSQPLAGRTLASRLRRLFAR
jgi:hypothetical protein